LTDLPPYSCHLPASESHSDKRRLCVQPLLLVVMTNLSFEKTLSPLHILSSYLPVALGVLSGLPY